MLLLRARARCHVKVHPEDGFDAVFLALFVELDGAVEIAVVGKCQGTLPVLCSRRDELGYFRYRLEKRKMGMRMEMDKVLTRHRASIPRGLSPCFLPILMYIWVCYIAYKSVRQSRGRDPTRKTSRWAKFRRQTNSPTQRCQAEMTERARGARLCGIQ